MGGKAAFAGHAVRARPGTGRAANGPGNWSLVECAGNDKSCPVNFPFDRQAIHKRFGRAANFLISLEVVGAAQHRADHSATYTCVPAAAIVSAMSAGSGLSVNSA
ncbi:hypothetical protein EGT33_16025 [Burkholderia multivorans]|nr:hypothetical protein EGT33_16025 [Burkholderia multivorans]